MAAPRVWQAFQLGRCVRDLDSKLSPVTALVQQVRYKKRQHIVNKKKEQTKWKPKAKAAVKVIKRLPPSEKWLNNTPVDDVWQKCFYPPKKYSLLDAIKMHSELNSPEMFDNMDGVLFVNFYLNMSTKKQTKFLGQISDTVAIPHRFEDDEEIRIIAFTKSLQEQEKAKSLGAVYAGDQGLIKEIESGTITKDDFDFVICTPDILQDLVIIRTVLKEKFPNTGRGNLGPSIEAMMDLFLNGKSYESERVYEDDPGKAVLQVMLGPLHMSPEQLKENFEAYRSSILAKKSKMAAGEFITHAVITCPPGRERFYLLDSEVTEEKPKPVQEKKAKVKPDQNEAESDDENEGQKVVAAVGN